MQRIFCFLVLMTVFIYPSRVHADIIINEFLIEPQQAVELLNTGSESANISHWYIDDSGGTSFYTIADGMFLPPKQCLVFSGDFNLNKASADTIRLFDSVANPLENNAHLIDAMSYKASSGSGISFARIPDGSTAWSSASASLGFFNSSNTSCLAVSVLTPPASNPTIPIPTPTFLPFSPTPSPIIHIYISEVMATPEEGNEWVELTNTGEETAYLYSWYIDDIADGGSSPIPFTLSIPAHSAASIDLPKDIFNNRGDIARLLNAQREEVDTLAFSTTIKGFSWATDLLDITNICLQQQSKNKPNQYCEHTKNILTTASSSSSTAQKKSNTTEHKDDLSAIKINTGIYKVEPERIEKQQYISSLRDVPIFVDGYVFTLGIASYFICAVLYVLIRIHKRHSPLHRV